MSTDLQLAVHELVEGAVTCGRGALQAIYAFFRISTICWSLIGPTLISLVRWLTEWYTATFTWMEQFVFAVIFVSTCVILRLWAKGTLGRMVQNVRLVMRNIRLQITLKISAAKRSISKVHTGLVSIGSIALPALAITVPLRFYTSKVVYRRLLSCIAAVVPQLYSISSLMSYYSSEATLISVLDNEPSEEAEWISNQVFCWLAYYMLAEVIDSLIATLLIPCRWVWSRNSIGIASLTRGVMAAESIELNPWTDVPLIGSWFHQPTAFEIESGYGSAIGFGIELLYSTLYFVVIMLAIKNAKSYLVAVIYKICEYIDILSTILYGSPLFFPGNSQRGGASPQATPGGALLPTLWAKRRSLMPLPLVRFIELASYMPQLLLLLLPSFILGPAYIGISTVLPWWRGARSLLQDSTYNLPDRAHLLTYFALFNFMEIFLMRWVRDSALWQILPVTRHMDVIYVTLLQLICSSPNAVAKYILNWRVESTRDEKVIIKEEPISDDEGRAPSAFFPKQKTKVT